MNETKTLAALRRHPQALLSIARNGARSCRAYLVHARLQCAAFSRLSLRVLRALSHHIQVTPLLVAVIISATLWLCVREITKTWMVIEAVRHGYGRIAR